MIDTKPIMVYVPQEQRERLQDESKITGVPVSSLIKLMIHEHLTKKETERV